MQPAQRSLSRSDETWSPTAETVHPNSAADTPSEPNGGVLRHRERESVTGSRTRARIAYDIAERAARRIGTLAILTALTVLSAPILEHALQSELAAVQQSPLYRLSALYLILAGFGLAALQRAGVVSPQELLDL